MHTILLGPAVFLIRTDRLFVSVYRSVTIFKAPAISLLPAGHLSSKSAKPQACTHKLLEQSTHLNVLVFSDTYTHTLTHYQASLPHTARQLTSVSLVISQSLFVSQTNTEIQPLLSGQQQLGLISQC